MGMAKSLIDQFERSHLGSILELAVAEGATDIHIRADSIPTLRIRGHVSQQNLPRIPRHEILRFIEMSLSPQQQETFLRTHSVNAGFELRPGVRFRCNLSLSLGAEVLILRRIPDVIPNLNELRLPPVLRRLAEQKNGLILVTGKAGSGKSTTMAALAQHINAHYSKHIVTIEDPIEYLLTPQKSMITQKEVGADVADFASASREVLRQDPDIIIIGEIRDTETARLALMAAETGHLVISTLHSIDAAESINRLLSLFEPHLQMPVRSQLASVLRAVVSQKLIPSPQAGGLIPAFELMIPNERIKKLITEPGGIREIPQAIEDGQVNYGMQSFDQSLLALVSEGLLDMDTALAHASQPVNFDLHRNGIQSLSLQSWSGDQDGFAYPEPGGVELSVDMTSRSTPGSAVSQPSVRIPSGGDNPLHRVVEGALESLSQLLGAAPVDAKAKAFRKKRKRHFLESYHVVYGIAILGLLFILLR